MRVSLFVPHLLVVLQVVSAQPPAKGGGAVGGDITCVEGQQATGDSSKIGTGTALLGAIACTDPDAVAYRRTLPENVAGPTVSGGTTDGLATVNIYGPFENGFTNTVPGMSCLGSNTVAGGIDTATAELVVQYFCSDATLKILNTCGDHATPRHFHEYLTDCLTVRTRSGGSSRLGTAADGRGIYGKYGPNDALPTLDACGAINAPTPDSNGASVVHYHAQAGRPFFLGCYTNADASVTLDECRALYTQCGDPAEIVTLTTVHGSGQYNKWCPCFDKSTQSNVKADTAPYYTRPAFLEALEGASGDASPPPPPADGANSETSGSSRSPRHSGAIIVTVLSGMAGLVLGWRSPMPVTMSHPSIAPLLVRPP